MSVVVSHSALQLQVVLRTKVDEEAAIARLKAVRRRCPTPTLTHSLLLTHSLRLDGLGGSERRLVLLLVGGAACLPVCLCRSLRRRGGACTAPVPAWSRPAT